MHFAKVKPDAVRAPDILVFEPTAEGHVLEWLMHLVEMAASDDTRHVWFIVAPQIHHALAAHVPPFAGRRIRIVELQPREERLCLARRLTVRGFAQWWIMRRHLRRTNARSGFALSLDHLSLPLAMGFGFGGATFSGVLFRPSVHYRTIGPYAPTLSERVRDLRKSILYRRMLANGALAKVLSLDPYFADFANARYSCGRKVGRVADPAFPAIEIGEPDRRLARRLPPERVRFVLFGSLQRRKGVLKLLEALSRLDHQTGRRAAIMIAGRADDDLRDELARAVLRVSESRPEIWLHLEDRRLASGEIAALIEGCDAVLAPYQRFVGSSGVLLWAAQGGKPVVTQDFGLVGRLVREHRLGLAADTTDAVALAGALAAVIRDGAAACFDQRRAARFAAARTPQAFAAAALASCCYPPTLDPPFLVEERGLEPLLDHNPTPRLITGRDRARRGECSRL
jgi:glycosyltransferase involved in cell wall biosynthesis